MIIRVKKRDILILATSLIFIALIPLIYSADNKNAQVATFSTWLVIDNAVPNVTLNNVTAMAVDPISGGSAVLFISFNITDPNGHQDINATKTVVNVTLGTPDGGNQWRFNVSDDGSGEFGTCENSTQNVGVIVMNCTITMRYYDNASTDWLINISVFDNSGGTSRNDTITFTYNTLASFSLTSRDIGEGANLNFSSLSGGAQNQEAKAPIFLNNTGNDDFDQINITAADLTSDTTGDTILSSAFAVNTSNSTTAGRGLALSTSAQTIPAELPDRESVGDNPNATLLHGPGGAGGDGAPYTGLTDTKGNQSLIFWIDVPSGKASATYNATWNITVVDVN